MSTTPGWPSLPPPKVPRRTRRGWLIVALLTVVLLGASAAWWGTRHQPVIEAASGTMAAVDDSLARRVLNASGTRGFARRATSELRDRGFDVVEYDTERGTPRSSTLIVSHTGHQDWAERLRRAVGTGSIESRSDTLRYLDLTIFVGRDWKPSAEALRP